MRTTVTIDDELLRRAKREAAESGRTLSDLVEDALRTQLARPKQPSRKLRPLPTFGSGGTFPGIDLSDNASVLAAMEEAEIVGRPEKWDWLQPRGGRASS